MNIEDLRIGMKIEACQRIYDHSEWLRIEFVAYDWAVGRNENDVPFFIEESNHISLYESPEEINERQKKEYNVNNESESMTDNEINKVINET